MSWQSRHREPGQSYLRNSFAHTAMQILAKTNAFCDLTRNEVLLKSGQTRSDAAAASRHHAFDALENQRFRRTDQWLPLYRNARRLIQGAGICETCEWSNLQKRCKQPTNGFLRANRYERRAASERLDKVQASSNAKLCPEESR